MADFSIPCATYDNPHCTELVIKRSRFLTTTVHAMTLNAGRQFVETLRRKYADANHNCWACVGGKAGDQGQAAASDDGEPHGTAGKPMLQILLHSGIGEICVVVTRWFGGIKLGTGGLVRAYQDAVRLNLENLQLKTKRVLVQLGFVISYQDQVNVERLLHALEADIVQRDYGSNITFKVSLAKEHQEEFKNKLCDLTNGRTQINSVT